MRASLLFEPGEALSKEFATLAEAFLINSVTDSRRYVPFHRDLKRSQTLRCMKQCLNRNELILIAVHQQHGWPTSNFGGESRGSPLSLASRAFRSSRRLPPAPLTDEADVKRHHGPLG